MAGISNVYYADITTINTIKPKNDGMEVTFASGKTWHVIEHDGANYNTACAEGRAYTLTVDLIYHGNQTQSVRDLDAMTQCRFAVKVVDNNGTEWLYGYGSCPLRFRFDSENGGEADSETAYRLTFESLCPGPERKILS